MIWSCYVFGVLEGHFHHSKIRNRVARSYTPILSRQNNQKQELWSVKATLSYTTVPTTPGSAPGVVLPFRYLLPFGIASYLSV